MDRSVDGWVVGSELLGPIWQNVFDESRRHRKKRQTFTPFKCNYVSDDLSDAS